MKANPVATKHISTTVKTNLTYHINKVITFAVGSFIAPEKRNRTSPAFHRSIIAKSPYRYIIHVAVAVQSAIVGL